MRLLLLCAVCITITALAVGVADAAALVGDDELALLSGGCPKGNCVPTGYCKPPNTPPCEDGAACVACGTNGIFGGNNIALQHGCDGNPDAPYKCRSRTDLAGCGNRITGAQCTTNMHGTTCNVTGGTFTNLPCGTAQSRCQLL